MSAILIRDAEPTDVPFIMDSWLKRAVNFRDSRMANDHTWFVHYRPVVERLLQTANCKVAAYADMPHQIFGYIVFEDGPVVHWLFVKKIMQNMGIGNKLLQDAVGLDKDFTITHFTDDVPKLYRKRRVTFNPILLMKGHS
jgi:hypothetical protein